MLLLKFTPIAERHENPNWRPLTPVEWDALFASMKFLGKYRFLNPVQDPIYPHPVETPQAKITFSPEFLAKLKKMAASIEIPKKRHEDYFNELKPEAYKPYRYFPDKFELKKTKIYDQGSLGSSSAHGVHAGFEILKSRNPKQTPRYWLDMEKKIDWDEVRKFLDLPPKTDKVESGVSDS